MSDLNPKGVEVELGGQKRKFLFTLNAIDDIQARCNMPLIDAMKEVANILDSAAWDHKTLTTFRAVVTALLNDSGEELEEEETGRLLTLGNCRRTAARVLETYGITVPDPDGQDSEEDEEDESPNPEAGR